LKNKYTKIPYHTKFIVNMAHTYCLVFNADILETIKLDMVQYTLQRYHPAGNVMNPNRSVYRVDGYSMPRIFNYNEKLYLRLEYDDFDITFDKDENTLNACTCLHEGTVCDFTFPLRYGGVKSVTNIKKCTLEDMERAFAWSAGIYLPERMY
jgi:hypothetical protein